ncbi:MAG: TetR/AcrR family transcriptional regulator, partial [Atopobiaceae bacterium]|nr:TetR/AcrR family transcriptional regulator [Atopobiaceae bacterium]
MAQEFIRAHGEEQKAVRVDQIVDAALTLYAEIGYDKLTFSKLAKGLGFSRINLYNYFKTKEDLFLEIVRREYDALLEDVEKSLPDNPCSRDDYIEAWTRTLSRHGRALEMLVLM